MRDKYYVQKQDKFWAVCHVDHDGVPVTDKLYDGKRDATDNCLVRNVNEMNYREGEGAPRKTFDRLFDPSYLNAYKFGR